MKLKCDICGGLLEMDASLAFAKCEFCGMKYSKESLQAKVQNMKRNGVDNSVSVQAVENSASLLGNAETYMKLGKYEYAIDAFKKVVEKYPDEPEGWWGVFRCTIVANIAVGADNFKIGWSSLISSDEYAQTAMKLHDYSQEYEMYWKQLESKYKKGFDYEKDSTYEFMDSNLKGLRKSDICLLLEKFEHPRLQSLQKIALSTWRREVERGQISCFQLGYYTKELILEGKFKDVLFEGRKLYEKLGYKNGVCMDSLLEIERFLRSGGIIGKYGSIPGDFGECKWMKPYVKWEYYNGFDYGMSDYLFCLGNSLVLERKTGDIKRIYMLILDEKISPNEIRKNVWKSTGRCTSCGGRITGGLFKEKKCEKCGKKY